MIRERVLGKWTPTPPGLEFWRTKIRFYPAGHKKKSATTTVSIRRGITSRCENEVFEKSKHSSWTVGHIWSSGNLITTTIIIYKETIRFNNNNNDLRTGTIRLSSYGRPPPLGGRGLVYSYLNSHTQLSRPMPSGHHISMEIPTTEPLTALGELMMMI